MNRLCRRLACVCVFALELPAAAQSDATNSGAPAPPAWPVSTAPARFTIAPNDPNTPAILSQVSLFMPDPAWEGLPIRVFTDTGVAVGSDVLWTAPGEPLTLLFDSSSGAKSYHVYVGSNWPPLHLTDTHAGIWLETRPGDGRVITTVPDMLDAWAKSTTVLGRAVVPGFFEGGNRFGPQTNLFLHLQGWFAADKPEHLDFAPVSVDSSFVLVDGKEVVKWPGQHDWGYGPQGPPQGGVDVTAGIHVIDYYNAYLQRSGGRPPVLACLSVKGGPYEGWGMLTPDQKFTRPVMTDHIDSYELQSAPGSTADRVPPVMFGWEVLNDAAVYSDYPDLGFVAVKFTCYSPPPGTQTWTFDDGVTGLGAQITHVFPRPGLRTVQLTITDGGRVVASVSYKVNVHLLWSPIVHQEPYLDDWMEKSIAPSDPASFTAQDLAGVFAVFGAFHKTNDIIKFAPAMAGKIKDAKDADLPFLKDAVLHFVHDDRDHYDLQEQLLRALIDRTAASTAPPLVAVASQSRLVLAQLLVKFTGQTAEIGKLVDAIDVRALDQRGPRSVDILRGDLLLASGDVDSARKKYQALTGDPQGPDARSSIRRTARISQARAFIDRKDYAAAEEALRDVSWRAPIEKLSPDWALTRLRLYEAENLPQAAFLWAKRLLPVINASGRSELLYHLTDLALAQNDPGLAHKTLDELLKKHPYSEEAAHAKERWPTPN
ncbi:MAG TPA: PKD domain-containing protein [Candidatus Methylacidiphilales bacterium]|jgi:tetratricopeptide (TPR) repeat protein|nr:PKD domain-containing protein [Candidatus Methylacidiphilales bacterium]